MVIAISTWCDDAHASVNVEKYIENHPMIDEFKDQDKQFDKKIEEIKKGSITNINKEITVIENFVTEEENLNESQKQIIEEVTNNVHKLIEQNDYINQWINYNKIRVILDVKYLNFEDWVDHVYMKKDPYTEDFKMWDIYINANQAVEATNAAYINTRDHWSMADYSANDWQEMYWSMPADTFTLQWIDPFEIHHPYRHEWTISINPEKLQDYIGSLKRLDLSYTKVSLWEVYFDPTVKENFEVKENVNVGIDTTTKDINVAENSEFNYVTIDTACIENIECDVETSNINVDWFVSVEHGMKVEDEFITHELDIDGTIELPDAKNIFIAGIHLEDWLVKAVQSMKIQLCCPPPPPPCIDCDDDDDDDDDRDDDIPTPDCPTWNCKQVEICETTYITQVLECKCMKPWAMECLPWVPEWLCSKPKSRPPDESKYAKYKALNAQSEKFAAEKNANEIKKYNHTKALLEANFATCPQCKKAWTIWKYIW